jgi:hypothetical protein
MNVVVGGLRLGIKKEDRLMVKTKVSKTFNVGSSPTSPELEIFSNFKFMRTLLEKDITPI